LKANLPSSTRAMFSDKARSFSQSERVLYGNFIIKGYQGHTGIRGIGKGKGKIFI